mgnify:CR=1 FL=1
MRSSSRLGESPHKFRRRRSLRFWRNSRSKKQMRSLAEGGGRRDKLNSRAGVKGCRARTFTTSTLWSTVVGAKRYSFPPWAGGAAAAAATFKHRNRAGGLKLVAGIVFVDRRIIFAKSHPSTREGILHEGWKPFKLYNVLVLQENQGKDINRETWIKMSWWKY